MLAKGGGNEIWLVQRVWAAGGRPSEASSGLSHQREYWDLMAVTLLSYKRKGRQPISIGVTFKAL